MTPTGRNALLDLFLAKDKQPQRNALMDLAGNIAPQPGYDRAGFLPLTVSPEGDPEYGYPQTVVDVLSAMYGAQQMTDEMTQGVPGADQRAGAAGLAGATPLMGGGAVATAAGATRGGLGAFGGRVGLDMSDAARLARAREMGFDTDTVWYHGTRGSFEEFDPAKLGQNSGEMNAFAMSSSPFVADSYAGMSSVMDWDPAFNERLKQAFDLAYGNKRRPKGMSKSDAIAEHKKLVDQSHKNNPPVRQWKEWYADGASVMPIYTRPGRQRVIDAEGALWKAIGDSKTRAQELVKKAKDEGYDSLLLRNVKDGGTESRADVVANTLFTFDPRNIRSINAAFDPSQRGSANTLASSALPPLPVVPQEDRKERRR